MDIPTWIWVPTLLLYAVLFIVDLWIVGRRPHIPSTAECVRWLTFYVSVAVVFGALLWAFTGRQQGVEFLRREGRRGRGIGRWRRTAR